MRRLILRQFLLGNVMVVGERGAGKDVLIGNVYARINRPYVSNQDYGYLYVGDYIPAEFDMSGNTYRNLISGNVTPYEFPYPKGTDIIISDGGIYFPSQYCNELNRDYKGQPMFAALSRQLARANVHINTQAYGRLWDKFREQCVRFIDCLWCVHAFGFVFQRVVLYDKAESCAARVKPCRVSVPAFGDKNARMQARIYRDQFYNQHGNVRSFLLIYKERSRHNTYQFEYIFKEIHTTYEEVYNVLHARCLHDVNRRCRRIGCNLCW